MAVLEIPLTTGEPCFRERVVLDGTAFSLRLAYNTRMGRYFLDIEDADGVVLLAAQQLEIGVPILARFQGRIAGLPAGDFMAFNEQGDQYPLDINSAGVNGKLLYFEAE